MIAPLSVRPGDPNQNTGEDIEADSDIGQDEIEIKEHLGVSEEPIKIVREKEDRFMRKLADPKMPTEDEVKRHELMGHATYRNWCPICVRSSGK